MCNWGGNNDHRAAPGCSLDEDFKDPTLMQYLKWNRGREF